ncbi:MAG: FkbM family methyltransferase [Chitinophagales bacterium]|nr:FkbM family methyltransferase [Chitinophagales bacterium]MCZ2393440.1 FkbM family methyltransferase [Chitinophagales bacterium]
MVKKLIEKILGNYTIQVIKSTFKTKREKDLILKRRKFYSQFLKSNEDIYFDVGANFGNRIEPIIDKNIKIIAVEPQAPCIKFLKNKYGDKLTIVPKGLGKAEETKTMYISNEHTISSFSKDWIDATKESGRFSQFKWNKEQKIEMTTLDHLINNYGQPKFIKIDVEGYEYEVLQGLSQPVEFISFEYTIPERKQSITECIDRIVAISNNKKVLFNYSVGESMEWALDEWLTPQQMKEEVDSDRFVKSQFGDIYSNTMI